MDSAGALALIVALGVALAVALTPYATELIGSQRR